MTRTSYNDIWKAEMQKLLDDDEKHGNRVKWESVVHAREYWERTKRDQKRILDQIELIKPRKTDRILDIGSGPGSIAIPAAQIAERITAVEPSGGMCTVLRERAEEENLSNISVIQKRWEDTDIKTDLKGPYDIVIASYSLSMADLKKEIQKMNAVCSGRVFLFWFAGDFTWEGDLADLWNKIESKDFYPGPKADILYGVLYEAGIYPEVTTFPLRIKDVFDSPEKAVEKICQRHSVTKDSDRQKILEYFREQKTEKYEVSGVSRRVCMWWDANEYPGRIN